MEHEFDDLFNLIYEEKDSCLSEEWWNSLDRIEKELLNILSEIGD